MVGDIKRTNTVGLEKWKNDQAGNEQLYKAYQNEKAYQQPRLLGNARATGADMGIGGMFSHFANQGIDLSSISDLQNKYNNLEKELSTANNKIKTQNDYNLQTKMIQEQEQRLAVERNRQAQINAQNKQKLEDERKKQVELAKKTPELNYYPHYTDTVNHINNLNNMINNHNNTQPNFGSASDQMNYVKHRVLSEGLHNPYYGYMNSHPSSYQQAGLYRSEYITALQQRHALNHRLNAWLQNYGANNTYGKI